MRKLSETDLHILAVVAKHEPICIGVPVDEEWAPIDVGMERLTDHRVSSGQDDLSGERAIRGAAVTLASLAQFMSKVGRNSPAGVCDRNVTLFIQACIEEARKLPVKGPTLHLWMFWIFDSGAALRPAAHPELLKVNGKLDVNCITINNRHTIITSWTTPQVSAA